MKPKTTFLSLCLRSFNQVQVYSERSIQTKTELKSTTHNALTSSDGNKMAMTTTTKKKNRKPVAAELWPEKVLVAQEPLSAQQNNAHNNRTRCARGKDITDLTADLLLVDTPPLPMFVFVTFLWRKKKGRFLTPLLHWGPGELSKFSFLQKEIKVPWDTGWSVSVFMLLLSAAL